MRSSASEGHYRHLFDTAPDAVVVVGDDGRIDLANLQADKLFGFPRSALVRQPIALVIPAWSRLDRHGQLFGCHKSGALFPIEVSSSSLRKEQRRQVSVAIRAARERTPLEAPGMVKTEPTDCGGLAHELRAAYAAAEAARGATREYRSAMSHDLRTPINVILGFAQLLQSDSKQPIADRHRDWVARILRGGEQLLRLVEDVVDVPQTEAGAALSSSDPHRA